MPPFNPRSVLDNRGALAQRDGRLGNITARIGFDLSAKLFALLGGAGGSNEHSIASRAIDGLHHQTIEIREYVLTMGWNRGTERFHVAEDRVFTQIVADHRWDEGVNPLIVNYGGSDGVGQTHSPGAVRSHQASDPKL